MKNEDRIQPYYLSPTYWQYKGRPVLLVGGSKTDHIFLLDDLKAHLDEIHTVGGNYVRNTMSQREAKTLKPYHLQEDGKFDLESWNEDYWQRFEHFMAWTAELEIFVQIEIWDRFDYSRDNWHHSPWNPRLNVNYTFEQTGLGPVYPLHPSADAHPFFHTIPGMAEYRPIYDLIRAHQERFVLKILSYTLDYGHVLYCMNNETSSDPAWGQYWIEFIQAQAAAADVLIHTTDMFDDTWKGQDSVHFPVVLDDPQHYTFVDISQINSRNFHEIHWSRMQWLLKQLEAHPRPANNTKIYGGNHTMWGSGGNEDGVQRFWRNLIGGCASARFHRPPSGNGLNERAKASIQAVRKLESVVELWEVKPQMNRLQDRHDEVYAASDLGDAYLLYFVQGGTVDLDLTSYHEDQTEATYTLRWLSVDQGDWGAVLEIEGDAIITLEAPDQGGWLAVITRA